MKKITPDDLGSFMLAFAVGLFFVSMAVALSISMIKWGLK